MWAPLFFVADAIFFCSRTQYMLNEAAGIEAEVVGWGDIRFIDFVSWHGALTLSLRRFTQACTSQNEINISFFFSTERS